MTRKRGRPPRDSAPLNRERIVATSLALLEHEGWAAFSMRRLAANLDVDTMALYRHFPDKASLVAAVSAQVLDTLPLELDPHHDWQTQLYTFAAAYLDLMLRYPNLIQLFALDPHVGTLPAAQINQPLQAALAQAGLSPQQIVQARDTIIDYLNGYGIVLARRQRHDQSLLESNHRAGLELILLGISALLQDSQREGNV